MAVIVIATVGASNANSFQTVAEIDEYFEARVPRADADLWTDADEEDKAAAAVMATVQMSALIDWTGYETTLTQSLSWPREGMWKRGEREYVLNNVIPQEVKNAHAEFARLLLISDRTAESDIYQQGLIGFKAGPVTMNFREYTPAPVVISSSIIDLLVPSWIDSVKGQFGLRDLVRT